MNNKVLVVVVTFLALVGLGLAYVAMNDENPQSNQASVNGPKNQTADNSTNQPASTAGSGQYVDYSEDVIASTSGNKVLFFHASWCPQCRAIESDINEQGAPNGYTIIKVDYDSNQDLRQKYGVTIQTTLVKVDDQGNEIAKYVAYNEPSLDAVKRDFL